MAAVTAAASAAANKVKAALSTGGPNIPAGSSRGFIDLIKAIGDAGSNHVRAGWSELGK
jgi:hypothetical protein